MASEEFRRLLAVRPSVSPAAAAAAAAVVVGTPHQRHQHLQQKHAVSAYAEPAPCPPQQPPPPADVLDCAEDSVLPPASLDGMLMSYVEPTDYKHRESWTKCFYENRAYQLPFPYGGVDFKRRVRSRLVTFSYSIPYNAAAAAAGAPMRVTLPQKDCESLFMACGKPGCKHAVLPLHISLAGYDTVGTPHVKMDTQLHSAGDKTWLPRQRFTEVHLLGNATHVHQYGMALDPDRRVQNDPPVLYYAADTKEVDAAYCEWLSVIAHEDRHGLLKDVFREEINGTVMGYLKQPDPLTNMAPSLLSWYLCKGLRHEYNGTNPGQYTDMTIACMETKAPYFILPYSDYENLALAARAVHEKSYHGMRLNEGLTLEVTPLCASEWKSECRRLDDVTRGGSLRVSVQLKIDYLVLGHPTAYTKRSVPPMFSAPAFHK